MTQRAYDTITLACLLAAIASAAAFQHAQAYQGIVGVFGVIAAVVTAITYYIHHIRSNRPSDGRQAGKAEHIPEASTQPSSSVQAGSRMATLTLGGAQAELYQMMFEALARDLPAKSAGKTAFLRYHMEKELRLRTRHGAGTDARRTFRIGAVPVKPQKWTALEKEAVHWGRAPRSEAAAMSGYHTSDMEPAGAWSEPALER